MTLSGRARARAIGLLTFGTAGAIACGGAPLSTAGTATSAAAFVDVYDSHGLKAGTCLGTLLAADTVLTAAHCVAGFSSWQVTAASGQIARSSRGYSLDWPNFDSTLSHPDHDDVAVLKLDGPIPLAVYPALAGDPLPSGAAVMRVRPGPSGAPEAVAATVAPGAEKGFPNYYVVDYAPSEALVAGGAVVDASTGSVVGVLSGRGTTSGAVYASRVESIASWIAQKASCRLPASQTATTESKVVGECGCSSSGSSSGSSGSSGSSSSSSGSSSSGGTTGSSSSSGSSSSGGTTGSSSSSGSSSSGGTTGSSSSSGSSSSGGTTGSSSGSSSGGTTGPGAVASASCDLGGGLCMGQGCAAGTSADAPACSGPSCGGCGADPTCADAREDFGGFPPAPTN